MTGKAPLRIIICTKHDLAGSLILNTLLPAMSDCTVTVLMSEKTRPVENAVAELAEIKFFERDLPVDTLFPLLDAAESGGTAPLLTFKGLAARHGVAMRPISDLNGPEGEALVRDFAPDLIISARFSLIFKQNIYDIPRLGTYNIHPGALPRYAGLFAPFRCMLEGGASIGCTLHRVDSGIDTGPVVGIGYLPIDPDRSLLWHVVNTYRPGIDLFLDLLDRVRQGAPVAVMPQDRSQRRYGSLPGAEMFHEFRAKGLKLFDPAEYLEILSGFLTPGQALPVIMAGFGGADGRMSGRGASCCCVPV